MLFLILPQIFISKSNNLSLALLTGSKLCLHLIVSNTNPVFLNSLIFNVVAISIVSI